MSRINPAAMGCVGGEASTDRRHPLDSDVLVRTCVRDTGLQKSVAESNVMATGVRDPDEEEAVAFRASDVRRVDVHSYELLSRRRYKSGTYR